MVQDEDWDVPDYDIQAFVGSVLTQGLPAVRSVAPMQAVPVAAYFGDELAMVLVLKRTSDGQLLDDVQLGYRGPDGRWQFEGSSGGGGMPEWVLDRPAVTHPDWNGQPLADFGFQMQQPYGDSDRWVLGLTAMASQHVATVEISYGPHRARIEVPESGLVVVAFPFHHVDDHVEYVARSAADEVLATVTAAVLTDDDRRDRWWPDASIWR